MADVGRPPEFNEDTVKKLEEAFAMDSTVSEACFFANITRQTYYNHVKEDAVEGSKEKELFDRFEALRNNPVLKARQTVMKSLDDPKHAKWYLERKKKDEFSVRIENEHTGEDIITKLDEQNKKTKELIEEWQNANNSKQCDSQESDSGPEASTTSDNGDRQVNDAGPSESV